jgi:predicted NAD/FAD-binding protein
MNIAVVGSGITGIGAAWALSTEHRVTVYEAEDRPGGHTRTIDVDMGGYLLPIDTGFIVYNERNYPNLVNFFAALGINTKPSDMSFSVRDPQTGLEYAGSLSGVLANKTNLLRPTMWSILRGIKDFRSEQDRLEAGQVPDDLSITDYLTWRRYPDSFASHYLLPLAAAVWSGTGDDVARMPARTMLRFLSNHGLLRITDRPQWRTVTGGSRRYVEAAMGTVDEVLLGRPVVEIDRHPDGVSITDAHGNTRHFDQVVLATHADTTVRMLGDAATPEERAILGTFRYAPNRAVVHSDLRLMPHNRAAWASWNALGTVSKDAENPVSVTYWMNRLQNLPEDRQVLVSLNPTIEPLPEHVIDEVMFSHPQFDANATRAQRELGSIQGDNHTWFAGAYCGYGFHEDGLQAGLTVAAQLGAPVPWAGVITPRSPSATTVLRRKDLVAA